MVLCDKKDLFCFICGKFTIKRNRRARTDKFVELYRAYYQIEWSDDKPYFPAFGCSTCYTGLIRWSKKEQLKLKYKAPAMWFNPSDEHNELECYYCINFSLGFNAANKDSMTYTATLYVSLPVEHTEITPPMDVPDDIVEQNIEDAMEIDTIADVPSGPSTSSYVPSHQIPGKVKLITQQYLNNMCRTLELSQRKSEELASMLKENNLLEENVSISSPRKRQAVFIPYFKTENELTFCCDLNGLMDELHIIYDSGDWRFFIDSSKSGLKGVLLHNDNAYMPIPIAYSRTLKETHDTMKLIFEKIKYNDEKWDVSGDFKVIALVMGLQLGRTKNSCFICTFISTAKIDHYEATWEKRSAFEIGIMNVVRTQLVPPEKILLPTLHIKLGLVTNFIKALNKDEEAFKYLAVLFPKLSKAKISAGKIKSFCCKLQKCILIGKNLWY